MVQVTRGKNVAIETYDCAYKEFTATAGQTAFAMNDNDTAAETESKYHRVYVDNVEVDSANFTVANGGTPSKATFTIPACTLGQFVQIICAKTKNGSYSIAQGIQFAATSRNQEIPELGSPSVTEETLEVGMRLNLSWAQAANHDLMQKLVTNKKNDIYMVLVEKYKNTTPVSYRIFKECKVDDFGQGVSAGGVSMETCSFTCKWPFEFKTS
jgi:hypothetical protein